MASEKGSVILRLISSRSSPNVRVPPVSFMAKMALFARLLNMRSSAAGRQTICSSWSRFSAEMWMFAGSVSESFLMTSSMMRNGENCMGFGAMDVSFRMALNT